MKGIRGLLEITINSCPSTVLVRSVWLRLRKRYIGGFYHGDIGIVPFGRGMFEGRSVVPVVEEGVSASGGVLLPVTEAVSASSGIVANFFRTCFSAGRRMGLLSSVSIESRIATGYGIP